MSTRLETETRVRFYGTDWVVFSTKLLSDLYCLWATSSLVVIIFPSNCAFWGNSSMLCFYMSVKGGIRQVASFTGSTNKLSALLLISGFSGLLLFYITIFGVFWIVFNVEVVV